MNRKFYCPKCRQSEKFPPSRHLRDIIDTPTREQRDAIYTHLLDQDKEDFDEGNFKLSTCVTCPACLSRSPLVDWFMAGVEPLLFFTTDNLCPCGGEFWPSVTGPFSPMVTICDRCDRKRPLA